MTEGNKPQEPNQYQAKPPAAEEAATKPPVKRPEHSGYVRIMESYLDLSKKGQRLL
jgi:hypothetical protein